MTGRARGSRPWNAACRTSPAIVSKPVQLSTRLRMDDLVMMYVLPKMCIAPVPSPAAHDVTHVCSPGQL